jgi:hypothetical protein
MVFTALQCFLCRTPCTTDRRLMADGLLLYELLMPIADQILSVVTPPPSTTT